VKATAALGFVARRNLPPMDTPARPSSFSVIGLVV